MELDTIVGIDPGVAGGVAIKFRNQYKVHKMPDLKQLDELLRYYMEISETMLVVIETVRLLPHDIQQRGDEKTFGRANRIAKMLAQFEKMKAVMIIADIPYLEVKPTQWQSYLSLRPTGWRDLSKHERKKLYQVFANANFPTKVNLDVADSVCLLHYAIRNLKYNPDFVSILPRKLKEKLF